MEHRCGYRTFINQSVRLAIAGGPEFIARLRDVSASGAFIETSALAPYLGYIRLQLRIRSHDRIQAHDLEALAIRDETDGFGLEWLEFAPHCVCQLTHGAAVALRAEREPAFAPPVATRAAQRRRTVHR
jgi:hypothetical protein